VGCRGRERAIALEWGNHLIKHIDGTLGRYARMVLEFLPHSLSLIESLGFREMISNSRSASNILRDSSLTDESKGVLIWDNTVCVKLFGRDGSMDFCGVLCHADDSRQWRVSVPSCELVYQQ